MRNLHEIGPIRTEYDNAILWWYTEYNGSKLGQRDGVLYYYSSYENTWQLVQKDTDPKEQQYVIDIWRKRGSKIVTNPKPLPADFRLGY